MERQLLKKYISGEASKEERIRVFLWANADHNHMKELLTLRKLNDITIWRQNKKQIPETVRFKKNPPSIYRTVRVASVAAAFLLLLGINFYLIIRKQSSETVMQKINIPAGQRAELILADGTTVWLNAGSSFTFPNNFNGNSRVVYLDGEGYFDVKHNAKQHFIVKTSEYDINVLGTQFNVLAYSRSSLFEVSLLKGSLEICSANKSEMIRLEPDTRAYLSEKKLMKGNVLNYNNFLWKDGLICFDDEPVESMKAKLELYFDTGIIVENASFKTKKYTGKFRTKDGVEHILKVFQLKDKFIYEKDEEHNVYTIK
ncbi:MAG: FecR family protein [Tannerella sp.]|jgi:ferric-dicitrate binding protein FerR (iron transport regulator)|nr:FecR family protein [Tannerella sp.]